MAMQEIVPSGRSPSAAEVAKYVGEMATELATMARGLGASQLASALERATLEAEYIVQEIGEHGAGGTAPSRTH